MKLSVIIPAYNAALTLKAAVESCVMQDFNGYEILIVDNNSTDETLEVAKSLEEEYPNIIISSELKQGAAAARNHGVNLAKGEWLQFLDADDVLLPGKWTRQLSLVNDSHDWLIGAFIYREVGGRETTVLVDEDPWRAIMYSGGIGCMHSNLFQRKAYLKVGGMDEEMQELEDYELYFKLLKVEARYATDIVPSCVYIRYQEPTLSTRNDVRRTALRVELSKDILKWIEAKNLKYWGARQVELKEWLFRHIHRQATFNLPAAYKNLKLTFPKGLRRSQLDKSRFGFYFCLMLVFGFYPIECLRNNLREIMKLFSGPSEQNIKE